MEAKRPSIEQLRKKALQRPEVKEEYDALAPVFNIKRKMIAMRKQAGLTQEQMAKLLGTKKVTSHGWKALALIFRRGYQHWSNMPKFLAIPLRLNLSLQVQAE